MNYSANTSRSKFWDVVRGLGILSIVIGHSWGPAIPYVYAYHLAIFFSYPDFYIIIKNTAQIRSGT